MIIRLTRLPDINTDRQLQATPYCSYGRFSLLIDQSLWYGDLYSSHPAVTKTGWYWATTREDELLVSARGAGIEGEMLVRDKRDILAWLVGELVKRREIRKPDSITIEK